MKKLFLVSLVLFMVLSTFAVAASVSTSAAADQPTILEFNTMTGVPRPYTGATNPIRNLSGGGLPWVIKFAQGELKANGKLEVTVRGLVLDPKDPDVIARGIGGTNPSPTFMAIVSCLSKDTGGNPVTTNVSTAQFPASKTGNAKIEASIQLPKPCIAPIIFITSPTGAWFAANGF
jgi:hypothetical protein